MLVYVIKKGSKSNIPIKYMFGPNDLIKGIKDYDKVIFYINGKQHIFDASYTENLIGIKDNYLSFEDLYKYLSQSRDKGFGDLYLFLAIVLLTLLSGWAIYNLFPHDTNKWR